MNISISRTLSLLAIASATFGFLDRVAADPLPGRDLLKFSQAPMINTTMPNVNGTVDTYYGHDELSTAYGNPTTAGAPVQYEGRFMADDFADNLSSPIVHVKWWGSYFNDVINPQMPVNKFLISFETDVPQSSTQPFSHPGTPLLNQVVTKGALSPGSGTFTEKKIRGADPVVNESLYEYNAELNLNLAFPELKDTVYWLKIVALVDVPVNGPQFDPYNPQNSPAQITQWGWHNRDYTVKNVLASPNVSIGEVNAGQVAPGTNVWHFQDDSVRGDVRIMMQQPGTPLSPFIVQNNMVPQKYVNLADGPGFANAAYPPISNFSKDLAFELYTVQVPEPAGLTLLATGAMGLLVRRRIG